MLKLMLLTLVVNLTSGRLPDKEFVIEDDMCIKYYLKEG